MNVSAAALCQHCQSSDFSFSPNGDADGADAESSSVVAARSKLELDRRPVGGVRV